MAPPKKDIKYLILGDPRYDADGRMGTGENVGYHGWRPDDHLTKKYRLKIIHGVAKNIKILIFPIGQKLTINNRLKYFTIV